MMLWSFFGKIHDGLSVIFAPRRSPTPISNEDSMDTATRVPDDVLEGHFVVLANKGEKTKRFIVELHYLTDPAFLGLLERAKEEYGFNQKGVLAIPCHPQELEKILEEPRDGSVGDGGSKLTDSIQVNECSAIYCS
ncbi:Auxin-responsive protein SAUR40 [Spatholobus suberectus]|nr:Auxin-responsive protein SAUR40 [Spatholobus suberectus]